jgi:hypothetical protein
MSPHPRYFGLPKAAALALLAIAATAAANAKRMKRSGFGALASSSSDEAEEVAGEVKKTPVATAPASEATIAKAGAATLHTALDDAPSVETSSTTPETAAGTPQRSVVFNFMDGRRVARGGSEPGAETVENVPLHSLVKDILAKELSAETSVRGRNVKIFSADGDENGNALDQRLTISQLFEAAEKRESAEFGNTFGSSLNEEKNELTLFAMIEVRRCFVHWFVTLR